MLPFALVNDPSAGLYPFRTAPHQTDHGRVNHGDQFGAGQHSPDLKARNGRGAALCRQPFGQPAEMAEFGVGHFGSIGQRR